MGAREDQDEPDEPGSWVRSRGAPRHRRGPPAGLARPRRISPLISSPQAKKNAACASRRLVVGCSLFVNHNKNQTEETPTRIGGGGNEGGTRAMTANARAKEEEGELKEGGFHMGYHLIDRCHQASRHFQATKQSHVLM